MNVNLIIWYLIIFELYIDLDKVKSQKEELQSEIDKIENKSTNKIDNFDSKKSIESILEENKEPSENDTKLIKSQLMILAKKG